MTKKITHTIMDSVFSNYAKASFPEHEWLVMKSGNFDAQPNSSTEFAIPADLKALERALESTDVWIIHRLFTDFYPLIKSLKSRGKKIVIQTWGPDYLIHSGRYPLDVLEPLTLNCWKETYNHLGWRRLYREYVVWRLLQNKVLRCLRLADSVHFCIPSEGCLREDICESHHRFIYKDWTEHVTDQTIDCDYSSVILGNSGDPTNNHIDAISRLAKFTKSINKVVIPLSYGGTIDYAHQVEQYANKVFSKNRVVILKEWLPLHDYERIVAQCGTVVLYHRRQQAAGGFAMALRQNKNIILNPNGQIQRWVDSYELDFKKITFSPPQYDNARKTKLLNFFSVKTSHQFLDFVSREYNCPS